MSDDNILDLWSEKIQMKHSDHVFAYTQSGADYARLQGVPGDQVTAVMNTVDLGSLRAEIEAVTDVDLQMFQEKYQLTASKAIAYIGGIDRSKRIDLLAEIMDEVWDRRPEVKFIIAGSGDQVHLLRPGIERGQVAFLGRIDDRGKALLSRSSSVLVNPGRVGLIAAEALTMGLHVVTTRWKYHAPEIAYLEPGIDVTYSNDSAAIFADALLEAYSRTGQQSASVPPELGDMIQNFRSGILRMLERRASKAQRVAKSE
ncbi:glycosyltransferase [Labedella endophytica]|uniref:glycosyltransferase n=1 Tax=Labedella endophytica TaxID=1523160 RepID=UPI001409861E|nr:glycosyltransferase [Labedella endophytica]